MKTSSKYALIGIVTTISLVSSAVFAQTVIQTPSTANVESLPSILPVQALAMPTTSTIQALPIMPNGHKAQEMVRISDSVQLISAYSPLDEEHLDISISLWRQDTKNQTLEKITEYKSHIPHGLSAHFQHAWYRNEYIYTIEEAWEGWRNREEFTFDSTGNLVVTILQPSELELTIITPNDSKTIKPGETVCHGDDTTATTTQSTLKKILVNDDMLLLKKPYIMKCEFSDMTGIQEGYVFTDFFTTELHADNSRRLYPRDNTGLQTLEIKVTPEGKIIITQ